MKKHDDICKLCLNRIRSIEIAKGVIVAVPCQSLCAPLQWVNGKKETVETVVTDLQGDHYPYSDYKDVIAEIIDHARQSDASNIEMIRTVSNLRTRAILALRHADISVTNIASLLTLSRRQLTRLIRFMTKKDV